MNDLTLRYPGGLTPTTPADLDDNLTATINRCVAIADLIQAVSNSEDAGYMDDSIGHAAFAIIADLEDAKTMLHSWYERARVELLAQRDKDEKREALRAATMEILRPEYPNEEELKAEVDKRMRERLGVDHA